METIKDFVLSGIDISKTKVKMSSDPFWKSLREAGSELWLDTGDIDAAKASWTADMSALTTNNTLLNKEVQKGIYDSFIGEANSLLSGMSMQERIVEIAFILNARHGLRLVETFGGMVSVELHTDLAHDLEGIVRYGTRFYDICPTNFIIKVPLTATGLLGARALREKGVPINFTLEFSARQNALVTMIARPNYLNVFLGRLGAYVSGNDLGTGAGVGERTTIASQAIVHELSAGRDVPTKQIAASLRSADQLDALAGIDVFTMPTKVADEGRKTLSGSFADRTREIYEVSLNADVDAEAVRIEKLWQVDEKVIDFGRAMDAAPPANGEELAQAAREAGLGDMFPEFTKAELKTIDKDGKIPVHATWAEHIRKERAAVDTLLNAAGLASFAADQRALDKRIEGLIRRPV